MAQKRSFQWKDDDYTDSINRHVLGVIPYGLYVGFDPQLDNTLVLKLNHLNTGSDEVTADLVRTAKLGKVVTQQGVTVQEDDVITVAIEANGTIYPRIDTIVIEHQYVATDGGTPAIYKAITGTAAANPVAATVPFPLKQVALGYLYVPAGATSLTATGVSYTRANTPVLGSSPKVMITDKVQISTARKQFNQMHQKVGVADIIGGDGIALRSDVNQFVMGDYGQTSYKDVSSITGDFNGDATTVNIIEIFCGTPLRLYNGSANLFVSEPVFIETGEVLRLACRNGVYFVYEGGQVSRHIKNKATAEIAGNKGTAGLAAGLASLDGKGNLYDFSDTAGQQIKYIPKRGLKNTGNDVAGAVIFVQVDISGSDPTPLGLTLVHQAGGAPSSAKSISSPTGGNFKVFDGDLIMLVEDVDYWKIVAVMGADKNILSLSTAFNSYVTSVNNSLSTLTSSLAALTTTVTNGLAAVNIRVDNIEVDVVNAAKALDILYALEPSLVLKGGNVSSIIGDFSSGTLTISAGSAQIDGDIRTFDAYMGSYPVYMEKNPTNPLKMRWVNAPTDLAKSVLYNPYTGQRLEYAVKRAGLGTGEFKMSTVVSGDFDSSGLGRWSQLGFALMNGNNGTINMGGYNAVGYLDQPITDMGNPEWEYRTINGTFGEKKHALTVDENGPHIHNIASNVLAGGSRSADNGSSRWAADPTSINTGISGQGTPHENRQLGRAIAMIQRIPNVLPLPV